MRSCTAGWSSRTEGRRPSLLAVEAYLPSVAEDPYAELGALRPVTPGRPGRSAADDGRGAEGSAARRSRRRV
jgi:hypothetical protein